ncbi:hypothetical protein D1872_252450 [compost metagenome]
MIQSSTVQCYNTGMTMKGDGDMLMITEADFNNAKVNTSIMELDGRTYIVHLKYLGGYTCYLEDFLSKVRIISKKCENAHEAIEDAWNTIIKG